MKDVAWSMGRRDGLTWVSKHWVHSSLWTMWSGRGGRTSATWGHADIVVAAVVAVAGGCGVCRRGAGEGDSARFSGRRGEASSAQNAAIQNSEDAGQEKEDGKRVYDGRGATLAEFATVRSGSGRDRTGRGSGDWRPWLLREFDVSATHPEVLRWTQIRFLHMPSTIGGGLS